MRTSTFRALAILSFLAVAAVAGPWRAAARLDTGAAGARPAPARRAPPPRPAPGRAAPGRAAAAPAARPPRRAARCPPASTSSTSAPSRCGSTPADTSGATLMSGTHQHVVDRRREAVRRPRLGARCRPVSAYRARAPAPIGPERLPPPTARVELPVGGGSMNYNAADVDYLAPSSGRRPSAPRAPRPPPSIPPWPAPSRSRTCSPAAPPACSPASAASRPASTAPCPPTRAAPSATASTMAPLAV